jgi:hypothetical protein
MFLMSPIYNRTGNIFQLFTASHVESHFEPGAYLLLELTFNSENQFIFLVITHIVLSRDLTKKRTGVKICNEGSIQTECHSRTFLLKV